MSQYKSYNELKAAHQAEVNAFPFGFAFSDQQFEEMMKKWGLGTGKTSLSKIVSIGSGGYVQKKDLPAMHEMFDRQSKELKEFRKEKKNLIEEIVYEMGNHEYGYTGDPTDTLESLGKTEKDLEEDEFFADAWKKAKKKYLATCG